MRSILFTALTLATFAGFAAEPQEPESGDKLTREQLIRKLEEMNALVTYVPRAPERTVNYVAIDETWTGGDEGVDYLERLAEVEESFRALYVVGEPEISARRLKELATAVSHLSIQRRGAVYLGVAGGNHPEGVQLIKVEPGSPADKAGLRDWDLIAEFDGKPIADFVELVKAIAAKRPGDTVDVKFLRGRKEHTTRVTLERWLLRPAAPEGARRQPSDPRPGGFGHVEGRFILSGEAPQPKVIVEAGRGCGPDDLLDESLVVDPETKGIANIFIYLRRPDEVHPDLRSPPEEPVVLEIENCTFKPHSFLLRAGQPAIIKSKDQMPHEVQFLPILNQEVVVKVAANERDRVRLQFDKSEILPTRFRCNLHPHMVGYALMLNHPYTALTDAKGRFRIENLPVGEHRFTVWHERAGYLDRALQVTIEPNETTRLDPVRVPADRLGPPAR